MRAERILDAAAELLLRHGYRRITIEDVAQHAGIAKGAIYLHWKSREGLFEGVLQREAVETFQELLSALKSNPQTALPWVLMPLVLVSIVHRPVLRAFFLSDSEVLGDLARDEPARRERFGLAPGESYLQLLFDHHVIRGDLSMGDALYLLGMLVRGFFSFEPSTSQGMITLERRAELLAGIIQHALAAAEPLSGGEVAVLAEDSIALFTRMVTAIRTQLERAFA